jgi:hypothetical protein
MTNSEQPFFLSIFEQISKYELITVNNATDPNDPVIPFDKEEFPITVGRIETEGILGMRIFTYQDPPADPPVHLYGTVYFYGKENTKSQLDALPEEPTNGVPPLGKKYVVQNRPPYGIFAFKLEQNDTILSNLSS